MKQHSLIGLVETPTQRSAQCCNSCDALDRPFRGRRVPLRGRLSPSMRPEIRNGHTSSFDSHTSFLGPVAINNVGLVVLAH